MHVRSRRRHPRRREDARDDPLRRVVESLRTHRAWIRSSRGVGVGATRVDALLVAYKRCARLVAKATAVLAQAERPTERSALRVAYERYRRAFHKARAMARRLDTPCASVDAGAATSLDRRLARVRRRLTRVADEVASGTLDLVAGCIATLRATIARQEREYSRLLGAQLPRTPAEAVMVRPVLKWEYQRYNEVFGTPEHFAYRPDRLEQVTRGHRAGGHARPGVD
jgi:hypothetical protein